MKKIAFALVMLAAAAAVAAQQPVSPSPQGGMTTPSNAENLPVSRIGNNDLIGITVYDAPELTRTVRVSPEGDIRLPMVKQPIHAAGLHPEELEKAIVAALIADHVLVDPIVTVSILQYDSRSVTVVGAVRSPITFQAMGIVTLLDALSRAHGLAENAGSEILISRQVPDSSGKETTLTQRIPVRELLESANPALNVELHGGEVIRVPAAGRVFVLGDVRRPGNYFITDGAHSSVMKALVFSEGLGEHPGHIAYIFRKESGTGGRNEIPVQLKKIMDRKAPDVALNANDILYVPEATGRRVSLRVLQGVIAAGTAAGLALLYVNH